MVFASIRNRHTQAKSFIIIEMLFLSYVLRIVLVSFFLFFFFCIVNLAVILEFLDGHAENLKWANSKFCKPIKWSLFAKFVIVTVTSIMHWNLPIQLFFADSTKMDINWTEGNNAYLLLSKLFKFYVLILLTGYLRLLILWDILKC